jgi:hypothetical protein
MGENENTGRTVEEAMTELYAMKEKAPAEWAVFRSMQIEEALIEFNDHAEEYELDCIVAFKCTREERDQIVANMVEEAEEVLDDGSESEDSESSDG